MRELVAPPLSARSLREFNRSRAFRVVLVVAVLASLPGLASHLVNDDYVHRGVYQDAIPDFSRDAFSLYDFIGDDPQAISTLRERGYVPWWTSQDLRVRFFRPLSSATLAADIELFGDAATPALAHSALYFAGSVVLVFAILGMLLPARAALFGACIYALAGCHSVPLAWIAARHVLVAAFFGLSAVALHLAWRERGFGPGRWLALLALGLGMLSSESSLGAVALIACYELLGARGRPRERVSAAAPAVLLALAYLAWYTSAGYGARGTAMYLHPLSDPAPYLAAAVTRIPALLADMLASLPSVMYSVSPELALALAVLGLFMLALTGVLFVAVRALLPVESRRHLRWLAAGSLAALLPVAGGVIGGRLLAIAMLGGAAVLGCIFAHVFTRARAVSRVQRWFLRAAGGLHIGLFVGLGVLLHVAMPLFYRHVGAEQWRVARDSDPECASGSDTVLLAAADASITSYAPAAMLLMGREPVPRSLWVLSMAPQAHRIQVVDEHGFELAVVGARERNWWEWVHRDEPPGAGEIVQVRDMTIEVRAAERHGPSRLAVRFERRLDAPSLCFVTWRDGLIQRAQLPRPGQSAELPFEPGPLMR